MYGAVRDGEVDVIVAYTSDGRIEKYGLVLLKDDLGVLPSYDAILLVSARAAAKPGFIEALKPLVRDGGVIDRAAMQKANRQVDVEEMIATAGRAAVARGHCGAPKGIRWTVKTATSLTPYSRACFFANPRTTP